MPILIDYTEILVQLWVMFLLQLVHAYKDVTYHLKKMY